MIAPEVVEMRRRILCAAIAARGGAYILPHENHQPEAGLRIASIRLGDIQAIGATEAQAQADYFRQAAQAAGGAA